MRICNFSSAPTTSRKFTHGLSSTSLFTTPGSFQKNSRIVQISPKDSLNFSSLTFGFTLLLSDVPAISASTSLIDKLKKYTRYGWLDTLLKLLISQCDLTGPQSLEAFVRKIINFFHVFADCDTEEELEPENSHTNVQDFKPSKEDYIPSRTNEEKCSDDN